MAEAGANRKPLVVVAVIGAVVVLVFVLGVGLGGGSPTGDGGWQERLRGLGAGAALTPSDLVLAEGNCTVDGARIVVGGSCVFDVAPAGGRFSLGPPTRRTTLRNGPLAVALAFEVEDQDISVRLDPGEAQDLTFGRSGGRLGLACLGAFACEVAILPP